MNGKVVNYNAERGFGFLRPDSATGGDKDIYFHVSGLVDKAQNPDRGDLVSFDLIDGTRGPQAVDIKLVSKGNTSDALRHETGHRILGRVKSFNPSRGFGFIAGEDGEDYFVHVNDLAATSPGYRYLAADEPVEFLQGRNSDGRRVALDVASQLERVAGHVISFDHQKGYGFIEPSNSEGQEVFLHYRHILHSAGRSTAVVGELVEYNVEDGPRGPEARLVKRLDPRLPLFRFASLGREERWLDELAALAEDEPWDFRDAIAGDRAETDSHKPILKSYLAYTFARLEEEQATAEGKIVTASDGTKEWACFNTGLVTPLQEEIFALFVEDEAASRTGNVRKLVGFRVSSDRELLDHFPSLPKLANYFDDPADLLYDRRRELHIDVEHVVGENLHRFPEAVRNEHLARQLLQAARADTEQRVYRNYKTAIPQYHRGAIQLLLPLCLESRGKADLALVVSKSEGYYRGETVLTLEMAYNNARLLTRPDDEWLRP